ncbi:MAG: response regulator [Aeromicrobium sp.]|nr:response regulator [Aeromicrobium sp.]
MMPDVTAPGGRTRILLVDDDLSLAAGLKNALERGGYTVLVVAQGARALEAAERFRPDVVLLDVMMPGMDGWTVLQRFRANPPTENLPVIMLTSADTEAAKVKGFSLGADDYVTKPFGLQELRCRIGAILRRTAAAPGDEEAVTIPVVTGTSGVDLIRASDVYYIEGVRNYTYVHTFDGRSLCRLTLRELEERHIKGFMRVQRSFIVNLEHIKGCGWVTRSSYQLRLADLAGTTISVSRALIPEVQRVLGLKP